MYVEIIGRKLHVKDFSGVIVTVKVRVFCISLVNDSFLAGGGGENGADRSGADYGRKGTLGNW